MASSSSPSPSSASSGPSDITRYAWEDHLEETTQFCTATVTSILPHCHSFLAGHALLLHDHSALDLRHPVQRRLRLFRRRRGQRIAAGGSGEYKLISTG